MVPYSMCSDILERITIPIHKNFSEKPFKLNHSIYVINDTSAIVEVVAAINKIEIKLMSNNSNKGSHNFASLTH